MNITVELLHEIQQKIKEQVNVSVVETFISIAPKPYSDVILCSRIPFNPTGRALEYTWTISNMPLTTTEQLRAEYPIAAIRYFTLALSKQ